VSPGAVRPPAPQHPSDATALTIVKHIRRETPEWPDFITAANLWLSNIPDFSSYRILMSEWPVKQGRVKTLDWIINNNNIIITNLTWEML